MKQKHFKMPVTCFPKILYSYNLICIDSQSGSFSSMLRNALTNYNPESLLSPVFQVYRAGPAGFLNVGTKAARKLPGKSYILIHY